MDSIAEIEERYHYLLSLEACAEDFHTFIARTKPDFQFVWYHDILIKRLERLAFQKDQRLMVWMPPRHGKSEILTRRWPAWMLGRNPNREIVMASYSGTLANSFNRDAQGIMATRLYQEIFPDTVIPDAEGVNGARIHEGQRYKRTSNMCEIVGRPGKLYSVGVGGTLTGMGADDLLIDDPYKGVEEAYSESVRESVWNWITGTAMTRLEGGANAVICHTRWHEHDASGRFIEEMELGGDFAENWEIIKFPAIKYGEPTKIDPREEGEALWPDKYPIERLKKLEVTLGDFFEPIYQQNAVPPGGKIIKTDWLHEYDTIPETATYAMSFDLSHGSKNASASYNVGQVWAKDGPYYFIVDQVREKGDYVETEAMVERFINQWMHKVRVILIEDKANGRPLINRLTSKYNRMIPYKPAGDKEVRLKAVAPTFKSGHVMIPRADRAPWIKVWKKEMTTFPASPNDDQVDTTSQMLDYWGENAVAVISPGSVTSASRWK